MDVRNRIALVTGAGVGTGHAVSARFARVGRRWTSRGCSPEYGAAKAGLMRATTCLRDLPGVATGRALASRAPGDEPPPVSLDALCDAVTDLVEDESARGKVVVLGRG